MDEFIERGGAVSSQDLAKFLSGQLTRGLYEYEADPSPEPGCSSFTSYKENGERIFARNYDMDEKSPLAIVYTRPDDGRYASISVVNLEYLGFTRDGISSFLEKFLSLGAAYLPMDGINEKGLGISIHMSYQGPGKESIATDMDTGKFDLTSTTMVRMFLDKAATVEEAVELAENTSLHDDIETSFHYIVADASGNSAVLQWIGAKDSEDIDGSKRNLEVIYQDNENTFISSDNYRILTNFISLDDYNDMEILVGKERFDILEENLSPSDGKLGDERQAMEILSKVCAEEMKEKDYDHTLYSAVYNLSEKSLNLVVYENYDDPEMTFNFDLFE